MNESWFNQVAQSALSYKETLRATYSLTLDVMDRGIPGDFVECGVFAGAQCAMMAAAILGYPGGFPTRRIHLFDTFTGIPAGGVHDLEWIHPPGTSMCSVEGVQQHMRDWGISESLLVYHKGLFSDTLGGLKTWPKAWKEVADNPSQIALLRLDGDLYQSTKDALQLLPLVSPGGWVIVDDFGLSGARKAVLESSLAGGPAYFKVPEGGLK